jgi:Lipocalin-like domain
MHFCFRSFDVRVDGIRRQTQDHCDLRVTAADGEPPEALAPSDAEFKDEATSYIAYTGPFHVDEEKQHLSHSMFISLFPNGIGRTQPRVVRIKGDQLFLSTASPISSAGKSVNSHLAWRACGRTSTMHLK